MSIETTKSVRSGAQNANDARVIQTTRRNVQEIFRGPIDVNTSYESFTGTGGSYNSGYGAITQPTLVISRNKDQSRESVIEGAEDAGASYHEIVPFADSELMTTDHRFSDEVFEMYQRGYHGREIRQWVDQHGDVSIDRSNCPYIAQMNEDMSQYDLLIGSPGHECVERFNIDRRIIYDDTHPVEHDFEQTYFDVSDTKTRAELNEFLRNAGQLEPENMQQLAGDSVAQTRIGFLRRKVDDDASPHFIDDLSMALGGKFVTAKTLKRLKVFCGFTPDTQGPADSVAGRRIWKDVPKYDDGATVDIDVRGIHDNYALMNGADGGENEGRYWWVRLPDEDQTVVITTATDNDPVTKAYFEAIGANYEFRTCATDEHRYWRAQGLTVRQTSHYQNARSGGNINADRTPDLRAGIRAAEGLDHPVPTVDAKKSLETWSDKDVEDSEYLINSARAPSFNGFEDYNVGLVAGPLYYGDEYIEGLALFCDVDISVQHNNSDDSCSHNGCDERRAHCHDETGQYILDHMMESSIKQAVGRFGRDSDLDEEITVYVDSAVIPHELPTEDITDQMIEFSSGEKAVLDVIIQADDTVATAEIAEETNLTKGYVRDLTKKLAEDEFIDRTRDGNSLSKVHSRDEPVDSAIVVRMRNSTGAVPISEPVYEDADDLGPQYPEIERIVMTECTDRASISDPPDRI